MRISVAVCTSGRDSILHTLDGLSRQVRPTDEVVVVDQSAGALREEMARRLPGVRVVADATRGLSRARNAAISNTDGDWLMFTDDDCIPSPDWTAQLEAVAQARPDVAFVGGAVVEPLRWDLDKEVVGTLFYKADLVLNADTLYRPEAAMGANLCFRRDLLRSVGDFDPELGAGTELPAGEETDYLIRAVAKGFVGLGTNRLSVVHEYGARPKTSAYSDGMRKGNSGLYWKLSRDADPKVRDLAERILPFGPKKARLGRLTAGLLFPHDVAVSRQHREWTAHLDAHYQTQGGFLVRR